MAPARFVYLIEMGGYHKIGSSKDVEERARRLDVGPHEPEILHCFPSLKAYQVEMALHRRFRDSRVRREWFTLTPADVSAICSVSRCDTADDLPQGLAAPKGRSVNVTIGLPREEFDRLRGVMDRHEEQTGQVLTYKDIYMVGLAEWRKRYPKGGPPSADPPPIKPETRGRKPNKPKKGPQP